MRKAIGLAFFVASAALAGCGDAQPQANTFTAASFHAVQGEASTADTGPIQMGAGGSSPCYKPTGCGCTSVSCPGGEGGGGTVAYHPIY